jgi:Na+/H+-translocating membrane pyrophosphatase
MTEETHPILGLTEETLEALLKRAIRNTLILGLIPAIVLLIATGWRDAAMLVTGALISAASIFEWLRLTRLINARMRKQKAQRGAFLIVSFFLLRLLFFAAAIYGSLKCFQGSPIALLCGLSLAVATLLWEAIRLLKE